MGTAVAAIVPGMGRARGQTYASTTSPRRHDLAPTGRGDDTGEPDQLVADDFAQAQQTLQALTETAVSDRERRPLLAAELLVPAVRLAQQIAEQLHNYDLSDERIWVGEGETARLYQVRSVSWATGSLRHRERHQAATLTLQSLGALGTVLIMDPRTDGINYDLDNPPKIKNFKELWSDSWSPVRYANATELAQWSKDALPLLQKVRERERARTEHLIDGLAASESTLEALAL